MISRSPALPKTRRTMIWSIASSAWRRLSQTVDPLAGGQSVGLEDHAERPAQDVVARLGGGVEDAALAPLLDLDLDARPELLPRVHDPVDRLERLGGGPAEQRVPQRRPPLRADDQRDLAREDVMLGVGGRTEDPVFGRRDARLAHHLLGEDLAPLQLGRVPARAEDPQPLALEGVDDAQVQRLLGTDDRQPDPLPLGELDQAAGVVWLDRDVLGSSAVPALPGRTRPPEPAAIASASSRGRAPAPPYRSLGLSKSQLPAHFPAVGLVNHHFIGRPCLGTVPMSGERHIR